MAPKKYCCICRGPADDGPMQKCSTCTDLFHIECINKKEVTRGSVNDFICDICEAKTVYNEKNGETTLSKPKKDSEKELLFRTNREWNKKLIGEKIKFVRDNRTDFEVFCDSDKIDTFLNIKAPTGEVSEVTEDEYNSVVNIIETPSYIQVVTLRDYQLEGVSAMSSWYLRGVGGILADEMGLGKTIQTITFLAGLKHKLNINGPHLVVTPLSVLQNWANELSKFCPSMSFKKLYGTKSERTQIFNDAKVRGCKFDIYLTTYDTLIIEEAFFTDSWPWTTITIDEGHRIKNENARLRLTLSRLKSPFRLLLTGTPLQNNLHELWALLDYLLPEIFHEALDRFDTGVDIADNMINQKICLSSRKLLDRHLMVRRIKSEVEKSLLPKIHYKLSVPMTKLQLKWYEQIRDRANGDVAYLSMMSSKQLLHLLSQLRKVVNHPKQIVLKRDALRITEDNRVKNAHYAGCQFVKASKELLFPTEGSREWKLENDLRSLTGEMLIMSCGKLMLLDRLLIKLRKNNSRFLIFSQYTETLDILEEYVTYRFGPVNQAYYRLDGATNRIIRELNNRAFNSPDSTSFIYLISTSAGGIGINLATADTVILYDCSWNPQVDLQAQDRAHRIGQKKQVVVYRLVTSDTFEERIIQMAERKMILDKLVVAHQQDEDDEGNDVIADQGDANIKISDLVSILNYGKSDRKNIFTTNGSSGSSQKELKDLLDIFIEETLSASCRIEGDNGAAVDNMGISNILVCPDNNNSKENENDDKKTSSDDEDDEGGGHEDEVEDDGGNNKSLPDKRVVKVTDVFNPFLGIVTKTGKRKARCPEEICFCCGEEGELLLCDFCPKVYHLMCLSYSEVPKGTWACPWHSCIECDRNSSNSGGMQFRCLDCPISYCFDCWPVEQEMVNYKPPASFVKNFSSRGYELSKNILFYRCSDCESIKGKFIPDREKVAIGGVGYPSCSSSEMDPGIIKDFTKSSSVPVTKTVSESLCVEEIDVLLMHRISEFAEKVCKLLMDKQFCDLLLAKRIVAIPIQLNDRSNSDIKTNVCIRLKGISKLLLDPSCGFNIVDPSVPVLVDDLSSTLLTGFKKNPSFNDLLLDGVEWEGNRGRSNIVALKYSYPTTVTLTAEILLTHFSPFYTDEFSILLYPLVKRRLERKLKKGQPEEIPIRKRSKRYLLSSDDSSVTGSSEDDETNSDDENN